MAQIYSFEEADDTKGFEPIMVGLTFLNLQSFSTSKIAYTEERAQLAVSWTSSQARPIFPRNAQQNRIESCSAFSLRDPLVLADRPERITVPLRRLHYPQNLLHLSACHFRDVSFLAKPKKWITDTFTKNSILGQRK